MKTCVSMQRHKRLLGEAEELQAAVGAAEEQHAAAAQLIAKSTECLLLLLLVVQLLGWDQFCGLSSAR